jgi:hypothetical protein
VTPVKSHKLPEDPQALVRRIHAVREALGPWEGKALPYNQLAKLLGRPLSTVKRWEQLGRISARDAVRLAAVAQCAVDWILTGRGKPPAKVREAPVGDIPHVAAAVPRGPHSAGRQDASTEGALPARVGSGDRSQRGLLETLVDAMRVATRRAIEQDELEHTETHRRLLGELLTDLGVLLEKSGIRATELLQVAMRLRKEGKGSS